ncbi:YceI family protein [Motiliproteus coralliicola]|uniref:YceI family protein n=1 Tax=Motiliproteus coralliicola TaxID=2283196 RepID=A0A369WDR3_9GAMM|nr:YceI family protein [Motiliproteus coralliicola]RDE19787.1 YceI family protein [Motiliproteus coralliicola]
MKKILIAAALTASTGLVQAADYKLDPTHSFINFKTGHLGVSWLQGRFNDISGNFSWDADKPNDAMIDITINTASVDSNHAERDKHLRSDDFLDVEKYPTASFKSTGFDGKTLSGDLTLHGVTKPISFEVSKVGEGKDPWGGYRAGFVGTYDLKRSEFGIDKNLGPAAEVIKLELNVEGIRK